MGKKILMNVVTVMLVIIALILIINNFFQMPFVQEDGLPILSESRKDEITKAWLKQYDEPASWNIDNMRYYGRYDGYDIFFYGSRMAAETSRTIGKCTFQHGYSFNLYAYRNSEFIISQMFMQIRESAIKLFQGYIRFIILIKFMNEMNTQCCPS